MKKTFILLAILIGIMVVGFTYKYFFITQPNEKIYIAVEGESKIVALDPMANKIISTINLSIEHEGGRLVYAPHNVQVSPDMKTVWVTANASAHQNHTSGLINNSYAHGNEGVSEGSDEVIVINPKTDKIIKRIAVGIGLHLAHVALTPDSAFALVTAQNEGTIYTINAKTFTVEKKIAAPASKESPAPQEPHGIRIAPNGTQAYIAALKGKSLKIFDLKNETMENVDLGGAAVQAGVTPDGKLVTVSLYDTKQLAVYNLTTKKITTISLPENAKGPIQMYATPDSRFIYLADQGYYFDQPVSEWVYKIDMEKLEVIKEIKTGSGPHGVAISEDGTRVYVTNLVSGDVSIISTITDEEIHRIKVGKEPNGVSVWMKR